MKIKATKLLCFVLITVMLFSLFSCSTSLKSTDEDKAIVMTVGGFDVPYEVYRYFAINCKNAIATDDSAWSDEKKAAELSKEIEEATLKSIKDLYAIFSLAAQYDINAEDDYIIQIADRAVTEKQNSYNNLKEYKKALSSQFMNDSVYRLSEINNACKDKLYYAMISRGDINSDEAFLSDYIYGDGFIRVKQLLITSESSSKGSTDMYLTVDKSYTDEEALSLANELAEMAAAGEDFDALVNKYGQSLYMFGNTDGYYICQGMWDDENEAAAFGLKVGETSGVIKSDKGFSIYKRYEKDKSYIKAHYDELCNSYLEASFVLALEKRSSELEIITNDLYKSYNIKDIK